MPGMSGMEGCAGVAGAEGCDGAGSWPGRGALSVIPPMPPCIIAMLRQQAQPLRAVCCGAERVSVVESPAAVRPMPHIMPLVGALAVEPVACPAPHIWAEAGAAQARARRVAERANEPRMGLSSIAIKR